MGTSHCYYFGSLNICANLQNEKKLKGKSMNKNQFVRNKFCCGEDKKVIWVTSVQKDFQIQTLIKQLLAKYWFSTPKFQIFTKIVNYKHNWIFLDQLLLPFILHGSTMRGILSFNFASCELWRSQIVQCNNGWVHPSGA